ncbi:MAG: AAA family ATPase [Deltaproteobacteria bacterium]|nr:AAA family ATPase [Deltaproteobacteria bacterium]
MNKFADRVLPRWSRKPPLAKGCLAAAALVASADDTVSLARRATIDGILDELHDQEGVRLDDLVRGFQNALDRLRSDSGAARAAALASLARLADDPASVDVLLRVARAVALADGGPSAEVRHLVMQIAGALGQSPGELASPVVSDDLPASGPGRVIVVANEKGGTGKSTTAIHLAMGLVSRGSKVACLDLDGRQGTLSRFFDIRGKAAARADTPLVVPRYRGFQDAGDVAEAELEPRARGRFTAALSELADHDVVVVDAPGHASRLAAVAYEAADVLVTPLNDSFVDVDALAQIDLQQRQVQAPSPFCRQVWEERARRERSGAPAIDWIVARNRTGQLDSRNAREMTRLLALLSRRLGFRLQPGFSERVVFRGLFYRGLTLFDLTEADLPHGGLASFEHARQEVAALLDAVATAAGRSTTGQTE